MFIEPTQEELEKDFNEDVDFTIINACNIKNDNYKKNNLNSDVFITFNIEKKK